MSRRNILPRFVNASLNSSDNMSSVDMNDKSPGKVLVVIQDICKYISSMNELIEILNSWNPNGMFYHKSVCLKMKRARSVFFSELKSSLNKGEFNCMSIKFEISRQF